MVTDQLPESGADFLPGVQGCIGLLVDHLDMQPQLPIIGLYSGRKQLIVHENFALFWFVNAA